MRAVKSDVDERKDDLNELFEADPALAQAFWEKLDISWTFHELGLEGVAVSVLRPGGKGQFGDLILDVVTRGDHLERGARIRIVGHSAHEAIVEACASPASGGQA